MIIRTTFKDNGIRCTLVSTEESISTDIKALVKAKLIKWHEEEPADKKACQIGLTWRDGVTLNGREEDFYIKGERRAS